MKCIYTLFLLFIFHQSVSAEIGYVYKADLNGDGVEDSIMSGPQDLFGNGGGPFVLTLSTSDNTVIQNVIRLHPKAAALEKNGLNSKIWGFWHFSADSGELSSVILDGTFRLESIVLNLEPDSDGISKRIYELIFNDQHLINFNKVEDYVPPKYVWGK